MKIGVIYMACTVELIAKTNPQRVDKLITYGLAKETELNGVCIPYLCFK